MSYNLNDEQHAILKDMAHGNAVAAYDDFITEGVDLHDIDVGDLSSKVFDLTLPDADNSYDWMENIGAVEVSDICWEVSSELLARIRYREIFGDDE